MNLDFKDYEAVRKQLFIKVSPVGKILHEQKDAPYEKRENLAITAHVLLKQNEDYVASMAVTNPMLESFGVTKEQLFHDASANAPSIFPARITDMDKVMTELCLDLILEEDKADMTKEEIQLGERVYLFRHHLLYEKGIGYYLFYNSGAYGDENMFVHKGME